MVNNSVLHLEMVSGVAGDMLVGSLLALYPPEELPKTRTWLVQQLSQILPKEKISLKTSQVKPGGIVSLQIDFQTPEDDWYQPHQHHHHEKEHSHQHPNHHRGFEEIKKLIEKSHLSDLVKSQSLITFEVLAKAEGSIHGIEYRKVHFHEVGSLDAILEVCAFFLLLERWKISNVTATPLVLGSGQVQCAHGLMPVPVPAVLKMIEDHNIPYKKLNWETGELTTPTGLAILIGSGCHFPTYSTTPSLVAVGYGAGHKKIHGLVNLIRANIYTYKNWSPFTTHQTIFEIKVNIDDMSGEEIASLMKDILDIGAIDVCQYPVFMKKNRPGVVLEILCNENDRTKIGEYLLNHSSTLGYRYRSWDREILPRYQVTIEYQGVSFSIKEVKLPNGQRRIKIEDESLRNALKKEALKKKPMSRQDIIEAVTAIYHKDIDPNFNESENDG